MPFDRNTTVLARKSCFHFKRSVNLTRLVAGPVVRAKQESTPCATRQPYTFTLSLSDDSTYFELENNVQRPGCADDVAHDRNPHAHGEVVKALDGRYLGDDQRGVPDGDAKASGAGRQAAVRRRFAADKTSLTDGPEDPWGRRRRGISLPNPPGLFIVKIGRSRRYSNFIRT